MEEKNFLYFILKTRFNVSTSMHYILFTLQLSCILRNHLIKLTYYMFKKNNNCIKCSYRAFSKI